MQRRKEPVAKLASQSKFDDFKAGSIFRKLTYPIGHRRFAKNGIRRRKRGFGPEWSFATGSKGQIIERFDLFWEVWERSDAALLRYKWELEEALLHLYLAESERSVVF